MNVVVPLMFWIDQYVLTSLAGSIGFPAVVFSPATDRTKTTELLAVVSTMETDAFAPFPGPTWNGYVVDPPPLRSTSERWKPPLT